MKKITSILIAVVLVIGSFSGVFADTVTGSMYGEKLKELNIQDVASSDMKEESVGAIITAVQAGLMTNKSGETFQPTAPVKANESITIILKIIGQADSSITDDKALAKAKELNIVDDNIAAKPEEPATRMTVAMTIAKALKIEPLKPEAIAQVPLKDLNSVPVEYRGYIAALYQKGIFKGFGDGTFRASEELTREQMALLISRLLNK